MPENQPDFENLEYGTPATPAEDESLNAYNRVVSRHLRLYHDGSLLSDHEHAGWNRLFNAYGQ